MSSRSITWRRMGVGAVALATVAAGLPLVMSSTANAAPSSRLIVTQDNARTSAAAGTCTAFTVNSTDPFGNPADAATITVNIAESPETNTHDVDFCLVDGGTPFAAAPRYDNEPTSAPSEADPLGDGISQQYDAGPSITTVPADSTTPAAQSGSDAADADNPDQADDANNSLTGAQMSGTNNFNPSGLDQASFRSVNGLVKFGVVGLLPGAAATIDTFVDNGTQFTRNNDNDADLEDTIASTQRRLTFNAGGVPGSLAVNDAVTRVELLPEESFAAKASDAGAATHTFTLQAFNAAGDPVGNVDQGRLVATAGPNAPASTSTSNGSGTGTCTVTGNEGEPATCTYTASNVGTDTVTGFVNQTTGTPTPGLDGTEPRDTASATTTAPANTNTAAARTLVLTPDSASIVAGQGRDFTATVTDASGAPVNGVSVRFDENGPGAFQSPTSSSAATSTVVMSTAGAGRVTVRFLTSAADRGSNTVVATIATTGTQCNGSGTCADSSAVTITGAAASPSATPTASISPRPTTSASSSPSPSTNSACTTPASVSLDTSTIIATGGANVTVRGTANSVVDLFAYSRPSTTYRVVRSGNVGSDGAETYRVTPPTNTRLYAQQRGCNASPSIVLNVRTQISLNVVRNGVRNYTFSGRLLPARPNGLIASLYRVTSDGRQILAAQQRANAAPGQAGYDPRRPEGSYSIRRQFTGSGRFGFVVRTGQDLQNAPGSSNIRSLAVF